MPTFHTARYPLAADSTGRAFSTVRHWLKRGPLTQTLDRLESVIAPDGDAFDPWGRAWIANAPLSLHLKKRIHDHLSPFQWTPPAAPPNHHDETPEGRWRYERVEADGTVDFNRFNFTPALMHGWVYTGLESVEPRSLVAHLYTVSPVQLWLNGENVYTYQASVGYVHPETHECTLNLRAGWNDLYLYGVMVGWREARIALGLAFEPGIHLTVCTPIGETPPETWHAAESGLDAVLIKQFAFPVLPGKLTLHEKAAAPFSFVARVEMPIPETTLRALDGLELPVAEASFTLHPGESADLPITDALLDAMAGLPGENHLDVTIRPADGTPLTLHRAVWASKRPFQAIPYSSYADRKREALEHVARMPLDVLAAMCAVTLGHRPHLDSTAIALACEFMEQRRDCADFFAVSLIALMHQFGHGSALLPADRERIESAFRGFKYWIEEPGIDAMCYFTENHQILFHVTTFLAAQYWPAWTFLHSGYSAAHNKGRAARDIEAWILRRLRGNFSEWDSNAYMALDAFALLVLNEYGDDPRLNAMAVSLLHKLFFLIACQSFRGAHGSTHGRCYVSGLKSSRFENTSGLQRIGWGMGIFNGETRATGMLALAKKYTLPDVIQRIGAHLPEVLITHARASAEYMLRHDLRDDSWDARTITRRTRDYMLSACIDHRPGDSGIQEHLWQATFSPEAVVFTTYPGNSQEHGNARPNFWAGSVELPRVALHDRTVICLYALKPDVGLGFSHAYFPTAFFDEWQIDGQWAAARHGDGYIALWSDGSLHLADTGAHAGQELRSSSGGNAWIAHVGSKAESGSFGAFREAVTRTVPTFNTDQVVCITPSGDALAFAWMGDLVVNGAAVSWENFPHYDNLYTQTLMHADTMTIAHDGLSITLDLLHGQVIDP